ncbi:MAG: O-antigen ligase family protein [Betaproteobacteria bacterium]
MPIDRRKNLLRGPGRPAELRARTFVLLRFSLLVWSTVYLVFIATSGFTYVRSVAFALSLILALWLVLGAIWSDGEAIPMPPRPLLAAFGAWAGWSAASLLWSIHPAFSAAELGTEVGWGLCTAFIFYVAARSGLALRLLVLAALVTATVLCVLAIVVATGAEIKDLDTALSRAHGGAGAFSTYLVLTAPLLPLLLAPRPTGFGTRPLVIALVMIVFALILMAARITENRMFWLALAAGFVVAALFAAWRWRARLRRTPWRWVAVLALLLAILTALFVDALGHRARSDYAPNASVAQTFTDDPRIALWQHTFRRIGERPWLGFGFGKSILREELRGELRDPMLAHAHNIFVSQWLQTGAIGALLLTALLGTLAWQYWRFLRINDATLAMLGLVGLTLLVSFTVKNLTDDFLVRPNSKEFWAFNAMLFGWGVRRAQAIGATPISTTLRVGPAASSAAARRA